MVAVAGGEHRSESVAAALGAGRDRAGRGPRRRPAAGHPELIDELVAKLASRPDAAGVIAAAPLTDTVKRAREPRPVEGTPAGRPHGRPDRQPRSPLGGADAAGLPTAALREALDADPQRIAAATDDAMLVEEAGGKVLIHPSAPRTSR